jgi:hypothetical protein
MGGRRDKHSFLPEPIRQTDDDACLSAASGNGDPSGGKRFDVSSEFIKEGKSHTPKSNRLPLYSQL